MDPREIDALAERLRPHYSHFFANVGSDILLTAHSHQAWPDISRTAQLAAWDIAAARIDEKWDHIFATILPDFQRHVASRLGTERWQDLAIAPNTHELVYRLGSCFAPRHRVLTTDSEFYSLRRQLQRWREDGLELDIVPVTDSDAESFAERFIAQADRARPDWAALSYVCFADARVIDDLPTILSELAARDIPVLVDVYHAFNVLELSVDTWPGQVFVTGGGYKYAQTGEGAAWMLVPEQAERFRPRNTGWFSDFANLEAAYEADTAVGYGARGQRFFGATFDPTAIYRGLYVMGWMDEQGLTPTLLRQHSLARSQYLIDAFDKLELAQKGMAIATPRPASKRGGFITLTHERAQDITRALRSRGVRIDVRGNCMRLGPGPYTSCSDMDIAMDRLRSALTEL